MSELDIQREVQIAASQRGARLFRNNVGRFRSMHSERVIACGLARGSADLVGWRTITITPDMVGKKIAQFLSVEVKQPGKKEKEHQASWRKAVNLGVGCAGVARSVGDLLKILERKL